MPQVGKKHFSYTPKGKAAAKKYAKKVGTKLQEVGTVTSLNIQRKRERKPGDVLSVGKATTSKVLSKYFSIQSTLGVVISLTVSPTFIPTV